MAAKRQNKTKLKTTLETEEKAMTPAAKAVWPEYRWAWKGRASWGLQLENESDDEKTYRRNKRRAER